MSSGPVINLDYINDRDAYSDGESENHLLELFKASDSAEKVASILGGDPSWPMRYHLSPSRLNLLSWFPFDGKANLLEVGAGCGALTGLFCERLKSVTAIELTKMRAEILYHRHIKCDNLQIYAGNFNDISLDDKFDYVTCIGVLEYAGKFTISQDPYLEFLKQLRSCLKPGGTLIIAIENKFGLKYWAGVKEDHTGGMFESIENYPEEKGVRTFGKKELIKMLECAGFQNNQFYYPLPDYKLPSEIFSDGYLPSIKHNIRPGISPAIDYSNTREFVFDERLAMDNLIGNEMFDFFANSFLVFAKEESCQ